MKWLTCVALAASVTASAPAQTIQNGDFDDNSGWQLTSEGTSGTSRILGGFLELSVSFPGDRAQARQLCTSAATTRTVEVDVNDFGLGTTVFEMGWENQAGTAGNYTLIERSGRASATTSNPDHTFLVFRADRTRLGPSSQGLDNAVVTETTGPTEEQLINHLLSGEGHPQPLRANSDDVVDVADLVTVIRSKVPNP